MVAAIRLCISDSPQCSTNISLPNNTIDQSDRLEITCIAKYSGYWSPVFSCAPGLPGHANASQETTASSVTYRRVVAAADIADGAVLRCSIITFNLQAVPGVNKSEPRLPANADVPQFDFDWNTANIRVVKTTGKAIRNFLYQYFASSGPIS